MKSHSRAPRVVAAAFWLGIASVAGAHGFVGDRFMPPTILTDDPFAVDELTVPEFTYLTSPAAGGSPSTDQFTTGFEFDKEIFPRFAVGISDAYESDWARHLPGARGLDDLSLSAKYEVWQSDKHEAIFSIGLESDLGSTGRRTVDDPHTVFTPTVYWGKGMGDLPDGLAFVRPVAITGTLGQELPTSPADPRSLDWGFAVEYSLPYLQQQVKDIGLPAPLRNMIPLIEFAMTTDESGPSGGRTTGLIAPGVLWESRYMQIGGEVLIPVNEQTGRRIGAAVNVDIFIDDIFPNVFGHPLFGGQQ